MDSILHEALAAVGIVLMMFSIALVVATVHKVATKKHYHE